MRTRTAAWLALCTAACANGRGGLEIPAAHLPPDLPSLLRLLDDATVDPRRALAAGRRIASREPPSAPVFWKAARAAFLLADAEADAEKRRAAEEGVRWAERAIAIDPRLAEAHYFLALNLGLVAQVRGMAALGLVPRIIAAGRRAHELGADLERAGPLRLLGMLYIKAPPWPTSVGDIDEGLRLLRQAVERYPDEPLNRLFLAEALIADRRHEEARAELRRVLAAPPRGDWARTGKRWRARARRLLRRIDATLHHRDE
jgi:tetratricopeptide (TPR) repeat protein